MNRNGFRCLNLPLRLIFCFLGTHLQASDPLRRLPCSVVPCEASQVLPLHPLSESRPRQPVSTRLRLAQTRVSEFSFHSRCGHCKKLAPEYEKLGASFKKAKSVLIGKRLCRDTQFRIQRLPPEAKAFEGYCRFGFRTSIRRDEEYDQGKRKKIRGPKISFDMMVHYGM